MFTLPAIDPVVVTCITNTLPSSFGRPLLAVFSTNQDAPISEVASIDVAPLVRENGVTGLPLSSTKLGPLHPP